MKKQNKSSAAIASLLDTIKSEKFDALPSAEILTNKENEIPYTIKQLDPKTCHPWRMANRLNKYINDDSCADLIDSIDKNGQHIPVISRPINNDSYEIICGSRRLYVCKKLNIPILAAIVDIDDKDALLIMDAENRPRKDISPYERALDYKNWIDSGIYKNYKEIQEMTGIKKSWFSQLMSLSELDTAIVEAFSHPSDLKQKWGYELSKIIKKSDEHKSRMKSIAKDLRFSNYEPTTIYKRLRLADEDARKKEIKLVKNNNGDSLARIEINKNRIASIHLKKPINGEQEDEIIKHIKSLLE